MPTSKGLGRDAQSKKKSAPSKKPSRPAPPPTSFKSSEYVQESDNDEPENSEKENESDSDDESLPSDSTDVMITRNGKLQRPAGSSSSSENESESVESGSEADNEEEDEEADAPVATRKSVVEPVKKSTNPSKAGVVTFKRPPPYNPPVGFEKASFDGTQKVAEMFKKSSLEGKQIWYFTAPASLPISSIGEMPLNDAKTSQAILNYKDAEYGFIRESAEDQTYTKIMVPHGSDDGYRTVKRPIDQIFHLQQIVKLPGVHSSNSRTASSSRATVPAKKPVRRQPQGLKMRFRPIGFGDGEPGRIGSSSSSVEGSLSSDLDEAIEEVPVQFRRPVSIASDSSEADESSDSSESEEESSSSDVEMAEAPPVQPFTERRKNETSVKVSSSQDLTARSLKRNHGGEEERKSKHSSSRSSSIDDRELKPLKKKQTESQRELGAGASVSIEPQLSLTQRSPAKATTTSSQKDAPIRPSKSAILPQSSPAPLAKVIPKNDDRRSFDNQKSRKRDRSKPATPLRKSGASLHDLAKATGLSFTGEERKKKIKKSKHKE